VLPVYSMETSSCFFGISAPLPCLSTTLSTPMVVEKVAFEDRGDQISSKMGGGLLELAKEARMRLNEDVGKGIKRCSFPGDVRAAAFNRREAVLSFDQRGSVVVIWLKA
jgi:hypothetical protein